MESINIRRAAALEQPHEGEKRKDPLPAAATYRDTNCSAAGEKTTAIARRLYMAIFLYFMYITHHVDDLSESQSERYV